MQGIHVVVCIGKKDVAGRAKPGHDEKANQPFIIPIVSV
jgi:hypothetical protein